MKDFRFVMLLITLLIVLTACGSESSGGNEGASDSDSGSNSENGGEVVVDDDYPQDNINFIIPSSAGGGFDTSSRQIQTFFEEALGTNFVLENHPGGNTSIGTTLVTEGESDGYTIMIQGTPHLHFSTLNDDVSYEFEDVYPLGSLTFDPGVIRVRDDAPWEDLNDLIEYAKENGPGSLTASVSFLASNNFLALNQLEQAMGVEFNIVPFGGGSDARNALLGGEVDFTHAGAFNSLGISEGTRVIGVQHSSNEWPDITDNAKTFNEQLGTDIENNSSTYGLFVNADMVEEFPERYDKLVNAFREVIENDEFREMLEDIDEWEKIGYIEPEEYHQINLELLDGIKDVQHLFEDE